LANNEIPSKNRVNEKHRQIARAAAELFIRKGFLRTTVREIAHASGISVGTLYHYAKSKEDILSWFQDFEMNFIQNTIEDVSASTPRIKPTEALCNALEKYFTQVDMLQDMVVFWYQETRNLPSAQRSKLLRNEEVLAEMFKRIIKEGCECGEFSVQDITLAANNIIILGDMWAFRRWLIGRNYTIAQYIEKQTDFVLHGLRTNRY